MNFHSFFFINFISWWIHRRKRPLWKFFLSSGNFCCLIRKKENSACLCVTNRWKIVHKEYALKLVKRKKFPTNIRKIKKQNIFFFVLFSVPIFPTSFDHSKAEHVEYCSDERTALWVLLQKMFFLSSFVRHNQNRKNAVAVAAAVIVLRKRKYFWKNNHL